MKQLNLFGIPFADTSTKNLVPYLRDIVHEDKKVHLHTANLDHLVLAHKDDRFNKVIKGADIVVADGMPIVWYSSLAGKKLPERVTGVDLAYSLCSESKQHGFNIYLFGAAEGVAEAAKKKLEVQYPDVTISGFYSPSKQELMDAEQNEKLIQDINQSGANVLLVALGAPKQEIWINENLPKLQTNINIGVGATIDFMAGKVRRAPSIFQKTGLEWVYRLFQEPKRLFKRYFIDGLFLFFFIAKDLIKRRR